MEQTIRCIISPLHDQAHPLIRVAITMNQNATSIIVSTHSARRYCIFISSPVQFAAPTRHVFASPFFMGSHQLPLTEKVGLPLSWIPQSFPSGIDTDTIRLRQDFSQLLLLLSTNCDIHSDALGAVNEDLLDEGFLLYRTDDLDLDPKHVEALQAFLRIELLPVHYFQEVFPGGIELGTEDELVAHRKAVEAVGRLTPEKFNTFVREYAREKAAAGEKEWENMKTPTETGPRFCGVCRGYGTEASPVKACSKCQQKWYCGEECQKIAWEKGHKERCKLKCS